MSSKDTVTKTLVVAFFLCVVCSILVSGTAVILKPMQDENRILDRNKNILSAAGLYDSAIHSDSEVAATAFSTSLLKLNQGSGKSFSSWFLRYRFLPVNSCK